jgi:hypothetical protein
VIMSPYLPPIFLLRAEVATGSLGDRRSIIDKEIAAFDASVILGTVQGSPRRPPLYVYAFSPPTCESQYVVGSVKNSPCLQRLRIASSLTLMPRPGPVETGM